MNLVLWKIYFGINIALFILILIVQVSEPFAPVGLFIADCVNLGLSIVGLYSYLFKKHIFEPTFWKVFFWFNIIYSALFLLYSLFPEAPLINYLSYLSYGNTEDLLFGVIFGLLFGAPLLYANYKLSKGRYFEPKTKEQEQKAAEIFRWGMIQTALWGYSLVLLVIILLVSFIPSSQEAATADAGMDIISGSLIFAPILLFWLWVALQYKLYRWNWWRITLLLNSLLFSSLIVIGTFFYEPVQEEVVAENFDIIGILQFLIIIAGLIAFGREQLHRSPAKQQKKAKETIK